MGLLFVTFIAGALGSVSRFVVDAEIRRRWLRSGPWPTVVINVTGSLALGALAGWAHISHAGATVDTILGTGFCGGYTTFSTVSFETVRQLQETPVFSSWYDGGRLPGALRLRGGRRLAPGGLRLAGRPSAAACRCSRVAYSATGRLLRPEGRIPGDCRWIVIQHSAASRAPAAR